MNEPKKFTDVRALNKITSGISLLFGTVQNIRKEYQEHFGYFGLEDLNALMQAQDPAKWIKLKWVQLNGLETKGLNIDALVNSGLLQGPKDYSVLLREIAEYKSRVVNGFLDQYVPGIACFFKGDEVYNPLLDDDNPLFTKIESKFSISSNTQEELEFIQDLETMSKIFERMINLWGFSMQYIPQGLFMIETLPGGYRSVYPTGEALKRFRLCSSKTMK